MAWNPTAVDMTVTKPCAWLLTNKESGNSHLDFKPLADLPFNHERWLWEPLFKGSMTPPMTHHSEPAEAVARALREHFGTSSTTTFTAREAGRQAASVALRHLSASPAPAAGGLEAVRVAKTALDLVRGIIGEASMTGFNCHDGDWAERLYASQADTHAAVKACAAALAAPAATRGEPWTVESLAQWLHDEADHQESYPHHHWPEHPDDDGNRDGGFIKIVPKHSQAYFRQLAARCLGIRPFSGRYFEAIGATHPAPAESAQVEVKPELCERDKRIIKEWLLATRSHRGGSRLGLLLAQRIADDLEADGVTEADIDRLFPRASLATDAEG